MRDITQSDYTEAKDIFTKIEEERHVREPLSAKWLEMWQMYRTQPLQVNSEGTWHSKLNDGRVFEVIETVGSYIRNALFFGENWVELEAQEPNLADVVPLVNAFFRDALNNSNLKREFRLYLVQLLLLGNSAMKISWDDDEGIVFECLNMLDTFVESQRRYDSRYSYTYHEQLLNFAAFQDMLPLFNKLETEEEDLYITFEKLADSSDEQYTTRDLRDLSETSGSKEVRLVTFYCPVESMVYYIVGNECIGEAEVEECPWLFFSLFETPENTYGLSVVDSSIGLILENNVLMNRRLDNIAVSVDNMWLLIDDGVVNPDEVKTAPGKVITVGRPDAITPMHPPNNNFNISYTEAQVLDTKIDRNIGTGAMISANSYRTGERVTATEINSVKDAGGNRLTDIYEHIEANCVLPILWQAYRIIRKHSKKAKVVKLKNKENPNFYDYYKMLPGDLKHDYRIRLRATQSVIKRDRDIQLLTEFMTLIGQVPQFAEMINYRNLFYDLLYKFGFDEPSRYITEAKEAEAQPTPTAPQEPTTPLQQMSQVAEEIYPGTGANVVAGEMAAGNVAGLAQAFSGQSLPTTESVDAETEQQLLAAMNMPI